MTPDRIPMAGAIDRCVAAPVPGGPSPSGIRRAAWPLAVAVVAIAGVATMQGWHAPASSPPDDAIRVVGADGDVRVARTGEAVPLPPRPAAPAAADTLLAEGPPSLRQLHDTIAQGARDDGAWVEEARLRGVFTIAAVPGLSDLTITCGSRRCEVHGMADGDETTARLALRDPAFQDRLAALGYTAGSDLVSGRGTRSELVVYLDRSG